jgi:hypothetical protein
MTEPIPLIKIVNRGRSSWGNWCVHYTGLQHESCKAGVKYADVKADVEFQTHRASERTPYTHHQAHPCFFGENKLAKPCPHMRFPTSDQIRAHDEESDSHFRNTDVARKAITDATQGKRGVQGALACPVCITGKLGYSVASNGHIHARCSTAGCVAWME